ncbi:MAG: hypothetical protein II366_04190 [Clostridia bacterium]|nr:hypothetical protein [Clostridia bacterium]
MKGKAIAGLVLSIIGVALGSVLSFLPMAAIIGLPVAVVGLVLSVSGGKKLKAEGQPSGIATAGLVIGIIAVVFTAITFLTCGICQICVGAAGASATELTEDLLSELY